MNTISYIFSNIILVIGFIFSVIFVLAGVDQIVGLKTSMGFIFMVASQVFITTCACVTAINIKKYYKGGTN